MPIVTTTRALTMVRVGAGESWSRRSSLLCRQPCSVAAAPKAALIATAQPSSPGVTNWITFSEESSTRSARKSNSGGLPGGRDVGSVHERPQRSLGDGGLDLVGLGVVRDQRLALHLHGDVGIALAHLRQGSRTVLGVGHLEGLVERAPGVWREVGDHAHLADLDQLAAAQVAVG